jgi:hypothetical protein
MQYIFIYKKHFLKSEFLEWCNTKYINEKALCFSMDILGRKKRRAEKEKAEAEKRAQKQKKEQETLFKEFMAFIFDRMEAANKSNKFRTLKGEIVEGIGEMTSFTANNGTSIIVMVPDKSVYKHLQPTVFQLDIDVSKDRIHVFKGPYGPDNNFSLADKERAKKLIRAYIDGYRLFHDK